MYRIPSSPIRSLVQRRSFRLTSGASQTFEYTRKVLPDSADVVIIGGGSAGCHALYYLAKRGISAVLLERSKLTSGTTWHTGGLVWRLRPNDVDIELLTRSTNLLTSLENECGHDSGYINNGGLFIAHNKTRLDEYRRLSTAGNAFGIENYIMTATDIQRDVFPLLNPDAFLGGLYSPTDGVVDPAQLCTALTKAAASRHSGAQVHENCAVQAIETDLNALGNKRVTGVRTDHGTIRTDCVVNATGVWGRDLIEAHGLTLPLVSMRHAYIVSESIDGVRGMPNVRDHDASVYFRIQGSSIHMGGYESNPILLDRVPADFSFSLYDLDWSTFEEHVQQTNDLCPAFGRAGIKSTVCGPESFTPDHKALMGPDPRLDGLFHSCGFNSAGMMFGGGCGEQLAHWIEHGRPELNMFAFDVRRYLPKQMASHSWATERSHEAYAKNYSMVFSHDQPLAGRNLIRDPLHELFVERGAFMEEKQGWERPGYFVAGGRGMPALPYDWYGNYGHNRHDGYAYRDQLEGDCKYGISEHDDIIQREALSVRSNVALFNISYFSKMFLAGRNAKRAIDWIFSSDMAGKKRNQIVYTCGLNKAGGTVCDLTVTEIERGSGESDLDPQFEGNGYYIVAGGASGYYTYSHIQAALNEMGQKVIFDDVTERFGVLSVQGRNSRSVLQSLSSVELNDANMPLYGSKVIRVNDENGEPTINVRVMRISFVGELGYELHVPADQCVRLYRSLMKAGQPFRMPDAGYRALYALSHEKGYHLWNYDLRMDDTPLEAGLGFLCRRNGGDYQGKAAIDQQRRDGIRKRLVTFELPGHTALWGLEGVYRNGQPVGHLRRADFAYSLGTTLGRAFVRDPTGSPVTKQFLQSGQYELDVMGKRLPAKLLMSSPFDPENRRLHGEYELDV